MNKPQPFNYQKTNRYFAQIPQGLESAGMEELAELGAGNVKKSYRGIYFEGNHDVLYRVNYMARLPSRILAQLLRFDCHSTKYLYKTAAKMPWELILSPDKTFAVNANTSHSKITHSHYAALCLKDAVADYFTNLCGKRPNVDKLNPDVRLNLHIENNKATVSLDTSGGALHRRGYRSAAVEAPMQETLAAAIIKLTGWHGERPLVDPMCGSGTLLAEALMHYCNIPAGYLRRTFGFFHLPDYSDTVWQKIKAEAAQNILPLPEGLISGSDISSEAVKAAKNNLIALPHGKHVQIKSVGYKKTNRLQDKVIVTNPPYGIRLHKNKDMASFMRELGSFFKHRCKGSTVFLYLGEKELAKKIGLKANKKFPLKSGGLDGVLVRFDMY